MTLLGLLGYNEKTYMQCVLLITTNKKYAKNTMSMPFDMKRFAYGGFKVEVGR